MKTNKFLKLFSSMLFRAGVKENRVVNKMQESQPLGGPEPEAIPASSLQEAVIQRAQHEMQIFKLAKAERQDELDETAEEMTLADAITKTLEDLNSPETTTERAQKIFEFHIKGFEKGYILRAEETEKLIQYCENSTEKNKNFDKILSLIQSNKITEISLNLNSKSKLVEHFSSDDDKIRLLLANSLQSGNNDSITEWLTAAKSHNKALKAIYESLSPEQVKEISDPGALLSLAIFTNLSSKFLDKLDLFQKIILLNTFASRRAKTKIFDHISRDPNKKFESLSPDHLNILISYAAEKNYIKFLDVNLTNSALAMISDKTALALLPKVETKYKKFFKRIIENLSESTKNHLVNSTDQVPIPVSEKTLSAINPEIGKAIKKYDLKLIEGELRRRNKKTGSWMTGKCYFKASSPTRLFYKDSHGTKSTEFKNEKWEWDEEKEREEVIPEEISSQVFLYLRADHDTIILNDDNRAETQIQKGTKLSMVDGLNMKIVDNRTYVKVKCHENGKEGWTEATFLEEYKPSEKVEAMDEETEAVYEKYFIEYENVELTERKFPAGEYIIHPDGEAVATTLHTEKGEETLQSGAIKITDPKVYKISKKGSPAKYVVMGETGDLSGFIDWRHISLAADPEKVVQYESSEWSGGEKYREDLQLEEGTYSLKSGAKLFGFDIEAPQKYTSVKGPAEIIDKQIRIVEGKEYAKVKTNVQKNGKTHEFQGWIELSKIKIPETQLTTFEGEISTQPEATKYGKIWNPETGEIKFENRKQERQTKLRDLFPQKPEYKIIITSKRTGKTKVAKYIKAKNNYYFIDDLTDKPKGRALVFGGDKVIPFQTDEIESPNTPQADILGYHEIQSGERVSDIIRTIYSKYSGLEASVQASGFSDMQYYQMLIKNKQGNRLTIIKPSSAEHQYTKEIQAIKTEQAEEIDQKTQEYLGNSDHYLKHKFKIDESLLPYINNDDRWNDLLTSKGAESGKFIEGLNKVSAIMGKYFQIDDISIRGKLRELVQIGYNKHIDMEDVFKTFAKTLGYKKGWSDFKEEIQTNKKTVKKWKTTRSEDIQEIKEFNALHAKIIARKKEADLQGEGHLYIQSDEYQTYLVKKINTGEMRKSYQDEYLPAQKKLASLGKVLMPMAEVLDAISGMELKVSKESTTYHEIEALLGEHIFESHDHQLTEDSAFYDIEQLISGKRSDQIDDENLSELISKKQFAITIGKNLLHDFNKIAEDNGITPGSFSHEEILRLVLQTFSLETLSKHHCFRKIEGSKNKFLLNDIPTRYGNPKFIDLIKEIGSGDKIHSHTAKIKEVGAMLDKSLRAIKKLSQVFPEETQAIKVNWKDAFTGFFTGADTREIEYTMSALAEGAVTKPAADVLEQYMSASAAKGEIMDNILDLGYGIETFDIKKLKRELTKRVSIGVDFLPIMATKIPQLQALNDEVFKDGRTAKEAKTDFALAIEKFLESPDGELDPTIIELIRFGHLNHRIIEENSKTFEYSGSKEIAIIQKALAKKRIAGLTQKDLDKVEQVMIGGIGFGVASDGSGGGVGISVPIDLGDGWTLSIGAAVGSSKGRITASPTVSLSKKFALGERHSLTFSLDGTMFSVGGSVKYDFPMGKKHTGSIGVGAGVTVVGFYAGAGFGVRKDTNFEQKEAFQEAQKELGFEEVNALIKDPNATEKTIADAICRMEGVGRKFKDIREKYNLTSSVIVELFMMKKDQIESAITTELGPDGFNFSVIGGGAWAGVVNGIPVVAGYLELKWGNELVVVRSTMPGYEDTQGISDAIINQKIQEKIGRQVSILKQKTGDTGQLIYDAETGSPAILTKRNQYSLYNQLTGLDSQGRLDKTLQQIDIHGEKDPSTGLTRLFIGKVKGNLKVVPDPEIQESIIVQGNKILLEMSADSGLIFTRQEYYYPYKSQGHQKLTVITIKKNPKKTTAMILQEAPTVIHQRPGYLPEIRKGIGTLKNGETANAITYEEYKEAQLQITQGAQIELAHQTTQAGYEEYSATLADIVKPAQYEIRKGLKGKGSFSERFYSKHRKLYKRLSTKGKRSYNPQKLVALIQREAKKDSTLGGNPLTDKELSIVLTDLMGRGFMNIKEKRAAFLHNLNFAQGVLTKFFTKTTEGKGLKYSPSQMAAHIVEELKSTDITSDQFERIPFGTQILSVVGTDKIVGMRGASTYEADENGGILNLQKYKPGTGGIEGEIGKVILELVSPLDTSSNKEFMESGLSLKMIGHPGTHFLLGEENAIKVARCFRDKKVSEENKEAFEKFKAIVLEIRKSQLSGKNFIEGDGSIIPKGYKIKLDTLVGVGAYSKCGNATPLVNEGISILLPQSAAAGDKTYITLKSTTKRRDISTIVGVAVYIPESGGGSGDANDPEPTVDESGDVAVTDGAAGQSGDIVAPGAGSTPSDIVQ